MIEVTTTTKVGEPDPETITIRYYVGMGFGALEGAPLFIPFNEGRELLEKLKQLYEPQAT